MNSYKKMTKIVLKGGEELLVETHEGDKVRAQKARGSGVVFLQNYNKRMLDVVLIGDIQDVSVPEWKENPDAKKLEEGEKNEATLNSPGYKKFLKAREKLVKKMST